MVLVFTTFPPLPRRFALFFHLYAFPVAICHSHTLGSTIILIPELLQLGSLLVPSAHIIDMTLSLDSSVVLFCFSLAGSPLNRNRIPQPPSNFLTGNFFIPPKLYMKYITLLYFFVLAKNDISVLSHPIVTE